MINYLKNLDCEDIIAVTGLIGASAMFIMMTMACVMKNANLVLIAFAAPIASGLVGCIMMLICGIVCVVCEERDKA